MREFPRFSRISKFLRKKFCKTVCISGYFQILTQGHVDYVRDAQKLGGYLVVIVNSDEQAKLKSTPMVVSETARMYIMENLKGVDEVVLSIDKDKSVSKTIEYLAPDIFCNGGDRVLGNHSSSEELICNKLGIEMVFINSPKVDSSSGILQRAHEILSKKS